MTEYDEKGEKKHWGKDGVADILLQVSDALDHLSDFREPEIEKVCTKIVEENGMKLGSLIHPARLALTGKTVGPGFYAVVELLGKEESVKRLKEAVRHIEERDV